MAQKVSYWINQGLWNQGASVGRGSLSGCVTDGVVFQTDTLKRVPLVVNAMAIKAEVRLLHYKKEKKQLSECLLQAETIEQSIRLCLGLDFGHHPSLWSRRKGRYPRWRQRPEKYWVREMEGSVSRRRRGSVRTNFTERIRKLGTEKRFEFHQKKKRGSFAQFY